MDEVEVVKSTKSVKLSQDHDTFDITASQTHKLKGLRPHAKKSITQKFLRGVDGAESKQHTYDELSAYDIFKVAQPKYNLKNLSELYDVSSFHHAAVDAKVSNIVGLGYEFVESNKTKRKIENTDGDALERLRRRISYHREELQEYLDSINEDEFLIETLQKVVTDYEAVGNGYIEVGRTSTGKIGYIGHIPAVYMRVRLDRDGFVQIVSNQYTFFRNFGDTETPDPFGRDDSPNEVIHLKKYSPTSNYYGVPDIISAKGAVAGNEFSTRFNLDYFEHKAVPRYIITLKGAKLSDSSEQALLEFFETNLKGQNHRSMYIPLPADDPNRKVEFKMEAVESGIQDASFERYQTLNRDEILMSHRVPISKIGIPDGVSLAIARDADKTFKEQVCGPAQKIIEKQINKLIAEFTDVLKFKLNELTLTDEDTQSRIDERYLRAQTVTPNEVRARKNLPALPGGDEPIGTTPFSSSNKDIDRSNNATDSVGEGRNPKGEGRTRET